MSAWATTWAYEQDINPCGKKAVLVALAHFADESGFCYPSQGTLASMTSQGVSTVRRHLEELESEKVLKREHRYTKARGGGRTSDGFYLLAPTERLKPPNRLPLKSSTSKRVTAQIEQPYRSNSTGLPPNLGDDLLENNQGKEMTAYAVLFDKHYKRVSGDVRKAPAQGKAIKEILGRHSVEKALACYESQLSETWRKGHVDWLTVRERIAEFQFNGNGNGHKPRDAAFHARQAELARKLGREYRPDAE